MPLDFAISDLAGSLAANTANVIVELPADDMSSRHAILEFDVSLNAMKNTFKLRFVAGTTDVSETAIDAAAWAASAAGQDNLGDRALSNATVTTYPVVSTQDPTDDQSLYRDYMRHLALQSAGSSHLNAIVFENPADHAAEFALRTAVVKDANNAKMVAQQADMANGALDGGAWSAGNNENIVMKLVQQMRNTTTGAARLHSLVAPASGAYSQMPFEVNDSLSYLLTITGGDNKKYVAGTGAGAGATIDTRIYQVKMNFV